MAVEWKRVGRGANSGAMILLFIVVILLINLIAGKHYKRFDLTQNKKYTLSEQSRKIAASLTGPLKIYGFFRDPSQEKKKATDLLEQYRAASRNVSYRFVDPDREPGIARKYEVRSYGTLVLEYGDSYEKVYNTEEKDLTAAILKLTRKKGKKICFTRGHGEKSLDGYEADGLETLKHALEQEQYQTQEIILLREGIPEGCSLLVIAGPQVDLVEGEVGELERYLRCGGRVLILMDPNRLPNLTGLISRYGIKVGNDVVVDLQSRRFLGDALSPLILDYPHHEITKDLSVASIFSLCRSVEPETSPPSGITVQSLAKTSAASWAETDQAALKGGTVSFNEKLDRRGPVSVAAVSEITLSDTAVSSSEENPKARLVVFGDADFVTNRMVKLQGNLDLILNTIAWLSEENVLVSIRSKEQASQPLSLTARQGKVAFFLPVVVIPCLILFTGVFVFSRRRWLH